MSPEEIGRARGFAPVMKGRFMARDGAARTEQAAFCNTKLCFSATDLTLLADVLAMLAERPTAWFVKFSTRARDGMYLGRCFFADADSVGATWAEFKAHPRLLCSLQDDDFSRAWRPHVKAWAPPDRLN